MNPDAYKQPEAKPKGWACPCSGCAKAVKQERTRITEAIEQLNLPNSDTMSTILEIINPTKK